MTTLTSGTLAPHARPHRAQQGLRRRFAQPMGGVAAVNPVPAADVLVDRGPGAGGLARPQPVDALPDLIAQVEEAHAVEDPLPGDERLEQAVLRPVQPGAGKPR